jgi:Tfp pilus assembly protein PilE
MGQQQLLLIVLGVIIVGIAIVVGINLFQASAVDANRNAIIADLNNLAAKAQEYYKKPTSLGGGGNSSLGFAMPTGLGSNANGTYAPGTIAAASITFVGTGTEVGDDGTAKVKHTATVTATAITIAKNN